MLNVKVSSGNSEKYWQSQGFTIARGMNSVSNLCSSK